MKVLIHGAVNGKNFGDFLFASMFYNELTKNGYDAYFYEFPKIGISDFYRKYIKYNKRCTLKTILNADALVYFSGGYFGERTPSTKETIRRYLTYFPIGELFSKLKKKILIVGVGGAPITSKWLRKRIVKITNYSSLVIFRDEKTTNYYKKNGVKNTIETTTDTAICLSKVRKPNKKSIGKYLIGEKNIFLHVSGDSKTLKSIVNTIAPSVKEFIRLNPDWKVIIGSDNMNNNKINKIILQQFNNGDAIIADYDDPWALYDLLGNVDLIITPKLHVGIIGSSLGSSVISFPYHSEKTKRYYEQIKESGRSIAISDIDKKVVLKQINKYYNKPISIDPKIVELSRYNLDRMIETLKDIEKNEKQKSI